MNGPAPTGIAPDPCEGGEITPSSGGPGEGGIGTISHGSGVGTGGGNPCGGGRVERGHGPVVQIGGATTVSGSLDKAIIRRYIKRNINRIRYCYEKELASNPTLAGSVTATFEIGLDGTVTSSTATGMDVVAPCVAAVIKTIEFAKPQTITKVVYPFTFTATN